jgi:16S rRNA (guanine1207-N2)-methyltransferase
MRHPLLKTTYIDINALAIKQCEANLKTYHLQNRSVVITGDARICLDGKFDTVVLNPPIHAGKEVVFGLYDTACRLLTPRGVLYIVIAKRHGAESSAKFLKTLFTKVTLVKRDRGYYIYQATNTLKFWNDENTEELL